MHIALKILIALSTAAIFTGCSSNDDAAVNANAANRTANANISNSVKDDIDELELTIKMPFHPEEAVWREEVSGKAGDNRVPAPTDKKLVAVLRFLKEDADKVASLAEKHKAAAPATLSTEKWFPAELIAQSQTSGDETIKGASYAANDFLNPPYSDGKITRIDGTDYFVLELIAK
jgi:hypothetical protein